MGYVFRNNIIAYAVNNYVEEFNKSEHIPVLVSFGDFDFSPASASLKLNNIQLAPKQKSIDQNIGIDFKALSITIDGVNYFKLLNKDINVSLIEIFEPHFTYYILDSTVFNHPKKEVEKVETKENSPWLNAILTSSLENVKVVKGQIDLYKVALDTLPFVSVYGYNIKLYNQVANQLKLDKKSTIGFDSIAVFIENKYRLFSAATDINLEKRTLQSVGLKFENQLEKSAFLKAQKFKKPFIEFAVDSLSFNGLDLADLELARFNTQGISVKNLQLNVTERGDLHKPSGHKGKLINDWLMRIPEQLQFKNLHIESGQILYEMQNAPFAGNTHVQFNIDQVNLTQLNSTNYSAIFNLNLYNSPLWAQINFAADSTYQTSVDVKLQNLQKAWLNPILFSQVGAKITHGDFSYLHLKYKSVGVNAKTQGEVDFRYNGLLIKLNQRKAANKKKGHLLLTLAANLAVKSDNLPGQKGYVLGRFYKQRALEQGFFKHMIECLKPGAEQCLTKRQ